MGKCAFYLSHLHAIFCVVLTVFIRETIETYSCGNGRFIPGVPGPGQDVSFSLTKTQGSLGIHIHDDNLTQWLHVIPSLHDRLSTAGMYSWICMALLLPYYPEVKAKFAQDKVEGRSFEALELFFRHFLREGSIFAAFGLQNLRERQILTDLHLDDIQVQYRSMSEDLGLLDDAIAELDDSVDSDEPGEPGEFYESQEFDGSAETDNPQETEESDDPDDPDLRDDIVNSPFLSDLRAAIRHKDFTTVRQLVERFPGVVDENILSRAIHFYDKTVFDILLEHVAHRLGGDVTTKLLYRASKAGHIGAIRLLLHYSNNVRRKHARHTNVSATVLAGAVSGGHLDVVRYVVEQHGAPINGNGRRSPLSRAFKHRHGEIVAYLLKAGAILPEQHYGKPYLRIDRPVYRDNLARFIADMPTQTANLLLSMESSQGHLEMVKFLVTLAPAVSSTQKESPLYCATVHGHLSVVRFLIKRAKNIKAKDVVSLIWRAAENNHLDVAEFLLGHDPEIYPTLLLTMMHFAAISGNLDAIVRLTKLGGLINAILDGSPLWATVQCGHHEAHGCQVRAGQGVDSGTQHEVAKDSGSSGANITDMRNSSPWNIIGVLERHQPKASDVKDCPTTAAIQAQQRKATARRLLTTVKSSREKLLSAGARPEASATLKAFVRQVGTSSSIWTWGTRAIRDISEGYIPSSLAEIVSALQVANAMRIVVPPSRHVCGKQE